MAGTMNQREDDARQIARAVPPCHAPSGLQAQKVPCQSLHGLNADIGGRSTALTKAQWGRVSQRAGV
jgi:hypothetical protein